MTPKRLQQLKAKAFDILMEELSGQYTMTQCYERPIPISWPSMQGVPINDLVINTKRIKIYEWRIKVKNRVDLDQVLLDQAAKLLKYHEQDD